MIITLLFCFLKDFGTRSLSNTQELLEFYILQLYTYQNNFNNTLEKL